MIGWGRASKVRVVVLGAAVGVLSLYKLQVARMQRGTVKLNFYNLKRFANEEPVCAEGRDAKTRCLRPTEVAEAPVALCCYELYLP